MQAAIFISDPSRIIEIGPFEKLLSQPERDSTRKVDIDIDVAIIAADWRVCSLNILISLSSAAMTLDVYADLFDDDLDAVADALDRHAAESLVVKM